MLALHLTSTCQIPRTSTNCHTRQASCNLFFLRFSWCICSHPPAFASASWRFYQHKPNPERRKPDSISLREEETLRCKCLCMPPAYASGSLDYIQHKTNAGNSHRRFYPTWGSIEVILLSNPQHMLVLVSIGKQARSKCKESRVEKLSSSLEFFLGSCPLFLSLQLGGIGLEWIVIHSFK